MFSVSIQWILFILQVSTDTIIRVSPSGHNTAPVTVVPPPNGMRTTLWAAAAFKKNGGGRKKKRRK